VSPVYLYAVLGAVPGAPLGEGLAGEPVGAIVCGDVVVAIGAMAEVPAVSPDALRGHDTVVRRLATTVDALLPARFGAVAPDERALCERLGRVSSGLRDALARVSGCEQMILRVYASSSAPDAAGIAPTIGAANPPVDETVGEGTRYLSERTRERQAVRGVAELAPLRPALARFVTAERIERHRTPPLVASVYHLVRRGTAADYAKTIEDAAGRLGPVRVTVSGPWAPYAFAPALMDE
jgi:Gas vesicle synthesis protein GvpL/GvpF